MNGVRAHCVFRGDNSLSTIAFVTLLETHIPEFTPPFTGTIHSVMKYTINSPQAIISER